MAATDATRDATPLLRTLALCDLVDSTALVEKLGDRPAAELFRRHDRLARSLVERHDGREIDKTDGFLLLFERPVQAVAFALEYQRELAALGTAEKLTLRARVGIHVGDVVAWENPAADVARGAKPIEVEGLAKPFASRLMQLALPGQILLSGTAYALFERSQASLEGVRGPIFARRHGRYRFKGVAEPVDVVEVGEHGAAPERKPPSSDKARAERPWWARPAALAIELALAVLVGLAAVMLSINSRPAIAFAERDWVVVADLENRTTESRFDGALDSALRRGLEQSRFVNVLSELQMRDALRRMQRPLDVPLDRGVASELAAREGARAVLVPSVWEAGGRVRFAAEVIDPASGATIYTEAAEARDPDAVLPAVDEVVAELRARLGESMGSIRSNSMPLEKVTTADLEALKAFSLGIRAFSAADYAKAEQLLERAIEIDPGFAAAHAKLAGIHLVNQNRGELAEEIAKAVASKDRLTPRERLYVEAIASYGATPAEMIRRWSLLADLYPDFYTGQHNLGHVLWQVENRYGDAAAQFRVVTASKHPQRFLSHHMLGYCELASGHWSAAEREFRTAVLMTDNVLSSAPASLALARREHDAAESLLRKTAAPGYPLWRQYYEQRWIELLASRQQLGAAAARADEAVRTLRGAGFLPGERRLQIAALVIGHARADPDHAARLREHAARLANDAGQPSSAEKFPIAHHRLIVALLAARSGERDLAQSLLESARPEVARRGRFFEQELASIVAARLEPEPADGLRRIDEARSARASVQWAFARAQLLDATRSTEAAAAYAQVAAERGKLVAEFNEDFALTVLNLLDADLAQLRAAELAAQSGESARARGLATPLAAAWGAADPDSRWVRRLAAIGSGEDEDAHAGLTGELGPERVAIAGDRRLVR